MHWLRKIRNICAHNERLYTTKRNNGRINVAYLDLMAPSYKRERTQKLIDLIVYMKYYLPHDEYQEFIVEIKRLLITLQHGLHRNAFEKIRADIEIKDVNHLDNLLTNPKNIEYNKF